MGKYTQFIGVDVGKLKLDVYDSNSCKYYSTENSKAGIKSLIKKFKAREELLVLIDITGGYETQVTESFLESGFNVHKAQGRKVRQFISAYGQRAKTDKIDAQMLTIYGDKMQETLRLYAGEDGELKELHSRWEELKEMVQKEKNRSEHFRNKKTRQSVEKTIEFLEKQLKKVERDIKKHIESEAELKEKGEVIKSVEGVGEKTTITLLTAMPELGKVNRQEIAALAGLAPYANDSGGTSKRRRTRNGRMVVKRMLFMCALGAVRRSRKLKEFYERLIGKGKAKMVALVAVMRKLLIIINNACKEYYASKEVINS